ncbi:MAG: thiamine diphosphokinase [Raoultibacter sp.]
MATCALVGAVDFNAEHFCAQAFDCVIAVDGGYAHLQAAGVVPAVVMGDFDSLGYVPDHPCVESFSPHKDKSDMQLALERAVSSGFDELVVYGALAGRLDHTVANLQLFARFSEAGAAVTGIGDTFAVRFLTGPATFELPAYDAGTVSVFAANDVVSGVTERGLAYPLDDATLSNRSSLGLSNELVGKAASVSVQKGTISVFYPLAR